MSKYCLATAVVVSALASSIHAAENQLTPEQAAEGWIQLFDGETLFGWKAANKANWRVENGAIVVDEGEKGLLHTTTQFGNYVLSVDFRSAKGTNSGIFLRTSPDPQDLERDVYELNIADKADNSFPTGSLVKRDVVKVDTDSADWQTFLVTLDGGKINVKLDGKEVLKYSDPKPIGRGFVGLQFNSGKIEFRNIRLKPLGLDKQDLATWVKQGDDALKIDVNEQGELHLHGGRGQLESKSKFADFVLQSRIRSNGEASNSGLFFRSIPGEMTNGYECQLQNRYGKEGLDKRMIDCGTGGICRRQNARKIVAKDGDWYTLTIVANGKHFATWVDGYQTADWTDTRKADDNPRRGYRAAAGTLILQGHDASTDYNFRDLRVAETPPRRSAS
ncbi:MAG: DUF1080 domain-containing protein [Pirellulales bacterium]|nr:DUF1080 domain-containing protein [Pirellulales bacterium]